MQIEIKIDESLTGPKIVVLTNRITEEVTGLVERLSEETPQLIAGFRDETVVLLEQPQLIRAFAAGGRITAVTESGEYQVRLRLYELEERLDKRSFVRISNSEIINLKNVKGFDLSLSGTIRVYLSDGAVTYVSRRYVAKIKQTLGI